MQPRRLSVRLPSKTVIKIIARWYKEYTQTVKDAVFDLNVLIKKLDVVLAI